MSCMGHCPSRQMQFQKMAQAACACSQCIADACIAYAGIKKNGMTVFSAHQMGTARMGADPKKSCVDPEGQCWEVSAAHSQHVVMPIVGRM